MSKNIIVVLLLLIGINQVKSQDVNQIVIGTKHSLRSAILNEDREYWISLPDSYNDKESFYKSYPLLIVLDGNVHFKALSGMVNYMSSDTYRSQTIPEMIVVAIQNVDRRRDYTPDKIITVRENNSGGGENFLSFLEEELIPELDQKYRTAPYRILFGHSLGGLLATHVYMKEKTLFNSFIAVDPSFGTWDSETMDKKLDSLTEQSFERFIYIATANWGKRNIRNRDRHVRLFESLNNKYKGELPAKLEYFDNEDHSSVPIIAFHNGISAIFEGYGISYRDVEDKEQLTQHFHALSERLSWSFRPPEYLVNQLGYRMLQGGNNKDKSNALEFFILNVENYPKSSNSYDSLGEAYETFGDAQKAIENYKKSLELNPGNEHARMKIKELSKSE
ncbi:alpha/beta hydrolase-fold protein [Maribacter sp. PR1]|uniref:Alpha/beta hydrolase-fold protein n=1 Tax=Maribacter cobaltidurans TaxID=1178778 RepID=A0ABU7IWJ8_9FLAO|nr:MULTISPECIES: alpha/beta hydrolase-fold protein [Maribacter]MDC6389579.1 alpha/beta hydrolase-fold protein [Maribacter sp. PR1]MEE1976968.1 alpha/beta hydrolase-fold protein [Maribacter cobaltidurans]